jgi:hypothetical protein
MERPDCRLRRDYHLEFLLRLRQLAIARKEVREKGTEWHVAPIEDDRTVSRLNRLVEAALPSERTGQGVMEWSDVGSERDGSALLLFRSSQIASTQQQIAQEAVKCPIARIEVNGTASRLNRLVNPTLARERTSEGVVEYRDVRVQIDRSQLLLFRAGHIATAEQEPAEKSAEPWVSWVQLHRHACRRHGFGEAILPVQQAAELHMAVDAGRIEVDRVAEFLFSFRQFALLRQRQAEAKM